jgi:hypothetical protein
MHRRLHTDISGNAQISCGQPRTWAVRIRLGSTAISGNPYFPL